MITQYAYSKVKRKNMKKRIKGILVVMILVFIHLMFPLNYYCTWASHDMILMIGRALNALRGCVWISTNFLFHMNIQMGWNMEIQSPPPQANSAVQLQTKLAQFQDMYFLFCLLVLWAHPQAISTANGRGEDMYLGNTTPFLRPPLLSNMPIICPLYDTKHGETCPFTIFTWV